MSARAEFLAQRIQAARGRSDEALPAAARRGLVPEVIDPTVPRALRPAALSMRRSTEEPVVPVPVPVRDSARVALGAHTGVYRSGFAYKAGDLATFGGQLWLATADTQGKPGGCGDWRLITKRGQSGADGIDGKDAGLVDARAEFDRDQVTHRTTKVTLRALDTNQVLATLKPEHDSDGFLKSAVIRWAEAA